ncbi:MAG: hypothetical protein ACLFMX_06265, partial [Halobacteriales archaeon]
MTPVTGSVPDPLSAWVARAPEAIALVRDDATRTVAALDADVGSRAAAVAEATAPGDRVGIA